MTTDPAAPAEDEPSAQAEPSAEDELSVEDELSAALADALGPALDEGAVRIEHLRLLSGGASRETWAFVAATGRRRHELILQRTRGGVAAATGGPSMQLEDVLLESADRHGVPVPPMVVTAAVAGATLCGSTGGAARVTRRVGGEALGPRIVRDERFARARRVLANQCGRALAGIHSIDPAEVPGLRLVEPLERLRGGLDLLGVHRPAFELGLRWLAANRPVPRAPRVVHGDFRVGNLLVDEGGLRAVLDWELAHLGDPVEDLGWLCVRAWRFGGERPVGGVGEIDDLLSAYEAAGGTPVERAEVRWWTVAGTLMWGLICAVQARRHLDGHVRSVELATIGRRICETEYDLLGLLGVPGPGAPAPGPDHEAPGPDHERITEHDGGVGREDGGFHGRPTAAELVDAVSGHLGERVASRLEGSAAFHLKVAGRALGIVERELRLSPAIEAANGERLRTLGVADETTLAARIRAGELDAREDVLAAVRAAVVDRVRVANPKWLEGPDRP